MSNLSSRCRIWARDVGSELEMSNLGSRCRIWARDVESELKMSNLSSKCRIWAQNVGSGFKMSNLSSKCRIWAQNVESEPKMSSLSSKCRIWAQNVESELKMSNLSSKSRTLCHKKKSEKKKSENFFFICSAGICVRDTECWLAIKQYCFMGNSHSVSQRVSRVSRVTFWKIPAFVFFFRNFFSRIGRFSSSDSASRAQTRHLELRFDILSSDSTFRAQIRHLGLRFDISSADSTFSDRNRDLSIKKRPFGWLVINLMFNFFCKILAALKMPFEACFQRPECLFFCSRG